MAVHVAYIGVRRVDPVGSIIDGTSTNRQRLDSHMEHRVLYDATYAPNAISNPSIEEYLTLEDAAGYNLVHLSQTLVVTSSS